MEKQSDNSKREFLKKVAYVTPAILTLKVTPSFATLGSYTGSGSHPRHSDTEKKDGKHHSFFDADRRFFNSGKKKKK